MFRRAIERLGLVGVIKTDAHLQAQALSQAVHKGQEIHKVLGEQRELEVKFEELISQRAGLKSMANKSQLKENQEEVHSVAIDLRQKTRNLSSARRPSVSAWRIDSRRPSGAWPRRRTVKPTMSTTSTSRGW